MIVMFGNKATVTHYTTKVVSVILTRKEVHLDVTFTSVG